MGNLWSKAKGWIGKNVVLVGLVAWLSWLSDAVDKFQSASEKVNWILHWSWGHGLITSAIVVLLVLNERRINRQEYVTAQTQGDLALRVAQNQVREFREEMRPTLELVDYL